MNVLDKGLELVGEGTIRFFLIKKTEETERDLVYDRAPTQS